MGGAGKNSGDVDVVASFGSFMYIVNTLGTGVGMYSVCRGEFLFVRYFLRRYLHIMHRFAVHGHRQRRLIIVVGEGSPSRGVRE